MTQQGLRYSVGDLTLFPTSATGSSNLLTQIQGPPAFERMETNIYTAQVNPLEDHGACCRLPAQHLLPRCLNSSRERLLSSACTNRIAITCIRISSNTNLIKN